MNLTIDIGNTRTKVALFTGVEICSEEVFDHFGAEELRDLLSRYNVTAAILCSVASPDSELINVLSGLPFHVLLDHSTPLPVVNRYGTPQTLGLDRLAAVVGAWAMSDGLPALVIDAGTAITYEFLSYDEAGYPVYEGGNISPGMSMRFRALNSFTARLPLVDADGVCSEVGNSTETAIRNGVVGGLVAEIESYIDLMRSKYDSFRVFFTGGDANYFAERLKSAIFVSSNLMHIGLEQILQYNLKCCDTEYRP